MTKVLVVDDESAVRFALSEVLVEHGFEVAEAKNGAAALEVLEVADVVVTDLSMPVMDGMRLLEECRRRTPDLPVILLTARGSEQAAVRALKSGAWDYLCKPFNIDEVVASVRRAAQLVDAQRRARDGAVGSEIVGDSPAFRQLVETARRVAKRDITVLVCGETGTGKELIAGLIHAHSRRADRPLVRFNCAAVPPELAESELFGHARGAFTGAVSDRVGYFQRADGGTLVLDELGELPGAMQPKLLRALESGEVQRVGGREPDHVDVRVVACTHRQLKTEVAEGRFRADLYYRLAVVELTVPPLRDRPGDVAQLAEKFRRETAARYDLPDVPLSDEVVAALTAHSWPGNVRELRNAIARWLALSSDGSISAADPSGLRTDPENADQGLRAAVARFEKQLLRDTLDACDGNRSEAARRLRVTRTTLLDKLKRHGLR